MKQEFPFFGRNWRRGEGWTDFQTKNIWKIIDNTAHHLISVSGRRVSHPVPGRCSGLQSMKIITSPLAVHEHITSSSVTCGYQPEIQRAASSTPWCCWGGISTPSWEGGMRGGRRREETTTGDSHREEVEKRRKNTPGVRGGASEEPCTCLCARSNWCNKDKSYVK